LEVASETQGNKNKNKEMILYQLRKLLNYQAWGLTPVIPVPLETEIWRIIGFKASWAQK
jgi:hypothetical protein